MRPLIAANWKMFKTQAEAHALATSLVKALSQKPLERDMLIFAPFTALDVTAKALKAQANAFIGAQNFYPAKEGAFTGEIAPLMLAELGCQWVLAGHSERRHTFGESSAFVGEKTTFALNEGLKVMLCVGETLEERQAKRLEAVLTAQLQAGLANLPANTTLDDLAIAYEPVWAIGTGQVASNADVTQAHTLVRTILATIVGEKLAGLRLLYGGSVKPENASALLALDNVDGLLVGGASLQSESFEKILFA